MGDLSQQTWGALRTSLHENDHAEEMQKITSNGSRRQEPEISIHPDSDVQSWVLSFRRLMTFQKFASYIYWDVAPQSIINFDIETVKRSRYSADHANTEQLFLPLRRPVITFSRFGFYSCKYLGTIMSLASEFHRGTHSASQLHTSLIEKAAAGPRRPRRLADSTMQRAQTS